MSNNITVKTDFSWADFLFFQRHLLINGYFCMHEPDTQKASVCAAVQCNLLGCFDLAGRNEEKEIMVSAQLKRKGERRDKIQSGWFPVVIEIMLAN